MLKSGILQDVTGAAQVGKKGILPLNNNNLTAMMKVRLQYVLILQTKALVPIFSYLMQFLHYVPMERKRIIFPAVIEKTESRYL